MLDDEIIKKIFESRYEKIEENIAKGKEILAHKIKYVEALENIEIKYISAPHTLYEYAPKEIANAVIKFLLLPGEFKNKDLWGHENTNVIAIFMDFIRKIKSFGKKVWKYW